MEPKKFNVGVVAVGLYATAISIIIAIALKALLGMRVGKVTEASGLNIAQSGKRDLGMTS